MIENETMERVYPLNVITYYDVICVYSEQDKMISDSLLTLRVDN